MRNMLLGVLLTHLFWALVFAGMWWRLVRRDPKRYESVKQDFQDIRSMIGSRHWN
jgi:hypothetical protein